MIIGKQRDDLVVMSRDTSQGATAAVDDSIVTDGPGNS